MLSYLSQKASADRYYSVVGLLLFCIRVATLCVLDNVSTDVGKPWAKTHLFTALKRHDRLQEFKKKSKVYPPHADEDTCCEGSLNVW